jgi:adenylylsulfate kinase
VTATTRETATSRPAAGAQPRTDAAVRPGATVWLTGLPSAGKTTLARALAAELRAHGAAVEVLDGDEGRAHLTAGLGFSRADRDTNVTRIGWVAGLLARNGVVALVPVIAPYADTRAAVRAAHEAAGATYLEVHVATPLDVCSTRDVKGLYAKARAGQVTNLTGVDDPYEPPPAPDLRLDTSGRSLAESVAALRGLLERNGLL